ncbi:DUF397 domain-containing protein [Streptomyces xinghaiensis]|uniref:DUF397 domain-containing protein n=1 Tax=Streptomyces xinghaiensis TaxID=1038928 RepID=UPI00031C66FC|nr:DUF397 domain-containing protein [Streptomyces xinghaiensis]MZE78472.1 DUF397 domain-containing protein [Streptomyces sp. SID5475]
MPLYRYRKSSHSSADRECVEVATNIPGSVAIRDSKTPDGPILRVAAPSWAAFTSGVVSAGLRFGG